MSNINARAFALQGVGFGPFATATLGQLEPIFDVGAGKSVGRMRWNPHPVKPRRTRKQRELELMVFQH